LKYSCASALGDGSGTSGDGVVGRRKAGVRFEVGCFCSRADAPQWGVLTLCFTLG